MNRRLFSATVIAFVFVSLVTLNVRAQDTFNVDLSHSGILFKVDHLGFSYVYGRFNEFTGEIKFDPAKLDKSRLELTIKTASVDTNDEKRDQHLRSADFFNAKQFPTATFKSKSFKKAGSKYHVTGDLTLNGKTKSITTEFSVIGKGKDPWGGYRIGGEAELVVKRSDFGINYMPDALGEDVKILISIQAIRK